MPQPQQPRAFTPCPICSGERSLADLIGNVALLKDGASLLSGRHQSQLRALVCTVCGYVEFFAKDPQAFINRRPDTPIDKE